MSKRTLFTITLAIFLGTGLNLNAQDNVAKLNLGGLVFRRIELGYERVLTDKQSAALSFGYTLPIRIPGLNSAVTILSVMEPAEISSSMSGIRATGEYRFYLNADQKKRAPRGLYLGPYLYMTNYHVDGRASLSDYYISAEGNMFTFGGGAQIGVQWLIADRVSIDFTILGLGLAQTRIKGEFRSSATSPDYNALVEDISAFWENLSVIGGNDKLELEAYDNGIFAGYTTFAPGFRAVLSIGVAF
ncbi:MAG: DUF3575 domain-containing protein [Bacteroidales bacterium]|nr:DUF3575 domain-containing protein [Bacteroidales bacterium]